MDDKEKNIIFEKATDLINKYEKLDIIYIRVSTKDKGQKKEDQIPEILKAFNLDISKCLLVEEERSAYNIKKQKDRVFQIISELIKIDDYKEYPKNIYVWKLNRIYRNRILLVKFGLEVKEYNARIYSVKQKILNECLKYEQPMQDIIYHLLLQMYGESAEEESRNRAEDMKKSLTLRDDGKYYTNKNNMFGKKLIKSIINKGKDNERKVYFTSSEVEKIQKVIITLVKKGYSYRKVQSIFKNKKDINFSLSYISRLIKK